MRESILISTATALLLIASAGPTRGQQNGPPKILPIATADSYPEGSLINLICTVSGGQRNGLNLKWMKDGEELDGQKLKYSGENLSIDGDDGDISIMKIKNATHTNSGKYTCTATNPLGQDSTSVNIVINVELKWTKIPRDTEVGLNQELNLECDALGTPQPTIEWFKHSSDKNSNGMSLAGKGKFLKISRAQHKDSGLYECNAKNGVDETLRKIVQVKVRDIYRMEGNGKRMLFLAVTVLASLAVALPDQVAEPSHINRVAAGFVFTDRADAFLNLSDSIDANLSRVLDRNGPDMRPSRDFKDFSDITLNVSKRAWTLLHQQTQLAIQWRIDLVAPAINELLQSANVSHKCYRAIGEVFDGAKRMDTWAVKLLNSWGNFPTVGLFEGTYSDVGSFHTCVNMKQNIYIDHAHYCSLTFRPVMPSRKNFELVVRKEPKELMELFEQQRKNATGNGLHVAKDREEMYMRLANKTSPVRDAFTDILEHAQYHHYVYYKIGTCWPIECTPFDIRRAAKLAARRMVLMNGPVKCYSRYEDDYEEPGSVDPVVSPPPPNTTAASGNTTLKKLVISIWDKNDGIFIWKPHFYTAHKVALGIIVAASVLIISMTLIDVAFNRIPQGLATYRRAISCQYTKANVINVVKSEVEGPDHEAEDESTNGKAKFCLATTRATTTTTQPEESLSHIETHAGKAPERMDREQLSTWWQIVDDCSIVTNSQQFFTVTESQLKQIRCLDGIRCITMVWVIMTHTMMYNDWSAFARTREVEKALKSPVGQPMFNGSYLVDTFFLLSGLLSAYTAFRHCKGLGENFSAIGYILSRWLRLTPQIFFCSMLYIVWPALSYGPHWFPIVGEYSENCVENWWINVLHMQAFYRTEKMCNFVTWWISIDYLYHFFALACIWALLYAGHKLGFLSLVMLVGGQVCWQAYKHYTMGLPPNVMSTIPQTGAMWTEFTLSFFWKPYSHAVPFFFGFYLGYLMALKRKLIVRLFTPQRAVIGWLLSGILFVSLGYSTVWWVGGEYGYTRLVCTIFHVICPIVWSGTLCWTILACQHGYGGAINEFLSAKVFIILGKASYIIYLSHFLILFIYFGNQSLLIEPSEIVMIYIIVGNVLVSTIFGIILCIVFELPWLKTQKKLMKYL